MNYEKKTHTNGSNEWDQKEKEKWDLQLPIDPMEIQSAKRPEKFLISNTRNGPKICWYVPLLFLDWEF